MTQYTVQTPNGRRVTVEGPPGAPQAEVIAQAQRLYLTQLGNEAAARHGVPAALVQSVMRQESAFDPQAMSPAGAIGPMQLMPGTARELNVDPHDIEQNVDGGVRYLKTQLTQFGGDQRLAAAAYNAGPARVQRAGGVPNIPETRAYVEKVVPPTPGAPRPATPRAASPPPAKGGGLTPEQQLLISMGIVPTAMYQQPKPAKRMDLSPAAAAAQIAVSAGRAVPGQENSVIRQYIDGLMDGSRPIAQAFTLGQANRITAGVDAGLTGAQNWLAEHGIGQGAGYGMAESYRTMKRALDEKGEEFTRQLPLVNLAGETAGFFASPPLAKAAKWSVAAPTLGGRVARGALVNGVAGAGMGSARGETPVEVAQNAATGGAIGAGMGGAIPVAAVPAKAVARAAVDTAGKVAQKVVPPAKEAVQKAMDSATAKRAAELLARGAKPSSEMEKRAAELRALQAGEVSYLDVANRPVSRTVRAVGVAKPTAGEILSENAAAVRASTKPGVIGDTAYLTAEQRTPEELAAALRKTRDAQAVEDYRGPYAVQVPLGEDIAADLSDQFGRAALTRARQGSLAHRDMERVAEIDALLNPPKPGEVGATVELPPVQAPAAPTPIEDPQGISLATFLRHLGGVRDDGGELAARDFARGRNGKFQSNWVAREGGVSLDEAADRAWEAGFFPHVPVPAGAGTADNYHPVTGQMLLDALDREARGVAPSAGWIAEDNAAAATRWMDDSEFNIPEIDEGYWKSLEPGQQVSAAVLDRTRKALRDKAEFFARPESRSLDIAAGLAGRVERLDKALDQVPELVVARTRFRDASQAIKLLENRPGGFRDPMTTNPADYARWLGDLPDVARDANKVAIRQRLADLVGGKGGREGPLGSLDMISTAPYSRENLAKALGEPGETFVARVQTRAARQRRAMEVTPEAGSRTAVLGNDLEDVNLMRDAMEAGVHAKTGNIPAFVAKTSAVLKTLGVSEDVAKEAASLATDPKRLDEALSLVAEYERGLEASKFLRAAAVGAETEAVTSTLPRSGE